MMLADPGRFQPTDRVDCLLHLLPSAPPLKNGALVHFHSGTAEGIARLQNLIAMNPKMLVADQQLIQIYEQQGDTARARFYMQQYDKGMEANAKQ